MKFVPLKLLAKPCKFLGWAFDPSDGRLESKSKSVRLPPKLSKLLGVFIANQGAVLSRELLVETIWKSKIINEDALSRGVAELRKILGDKPSSAIYIETIPKKGYRFKCEVDDLQLHSDEVTTSLFSYKLILVTLAIIGIFLIIIFANIEKQDNLNFSNKATRPFIAEALVRATRITTDQELEHQPRLSRNGEMLAFSVNENNHFLIKIIDSSGKLIHRISDTEYHLYSPTFSNHDDSLLTAATNKDGCKIFLYQLPSLHKKELGLCSLPNISNIYDWSADGKTIAFVKESSGINASAIWFLDVETSIVRQLSFPSGIDIFDTQPKFSPAGDKLAFTRGTKSKRQILYISLNKLNKPIEITQSRGYITGFDWLKSGNDVIYDSNQLGDRSLFISNISEKLPLLLGARNSRFPSLDAHNEKIAFQEIQYNANIWQVNLADENAKSVPIIQAIKYNNFPSYSPDGQAIAFVSNREGKSGIWHFDISSKQQKKLLSIPSKNLFEPVWSKNGKSLLISSRDTDGYSCYILDIQSGSYHLLSELDNKYYSCQYSQDESIFALSKRDGEPSYILKLETEGVNVQLSDVAVSRFQLSNFNTIIYTKPNTSGLFQMDMHGKELGRIIENFDQRVLSNWMVKGHFLYYPKLGKQKGMWHLNLKSGEEKFLTKELPAGIGLTLSVNADHSLLLLVKTDNLTADIYLADIKKPVK